MAVFKCLNCGNLSQGDIIGVDPYGNYVTSSNVCPFCGKAALTYIGPSPQITQPTRQDPYDKCRRCANSFVNSRGALCCNENWDFTLRPRGCEYFIPKY